MPGKWPNRFRDGWEHIFQFNLQRSFDMYQDEVRVPIGDWAAKRMTKLGARDRVRNNSVTKSGFGRNLEKWEGRTMAYPTNVLHMQGTELDLIYAILEHHRQTPGNTIEETLAAVRADIEVHADQQPSNVLYLPSECDNKGHSAVFPVGLPDFFIRLFSRVGDLVVDPFAGSGTTGVAAVYRDRHYLGIDKLEENVARAIERISVEPSLRHKADEAEKRQREADAAPQPQNGHAMQDEFPQE